MTLIAIIIQALAFYCMYNTSQRAQLRKDKWSVWLQVHSRLTIIAALLLFILSFFILINVLGLGTGTFAAFLSVMTLASLIILLVPLTVKNN